MESVENSLQSLHTLTTAAAHPLLPLCLSPYIHKKIFDFYFFIFRSAAVEDINCRKLSPHTLALWRYIINRENPCFYYNISCSKSQEKGYAANRSPKMPLKTIFLLLAISFYIFTALTEIDGFNGL